MVACTVVSLGGGAFSWWRANLSRKARDESVAAARRAEETLREIRRQTSALETLAAAVTPDPLVLEHDTGILWRMRNTTLLEIGIERLENASEFVHKPFEWLPVVIPSKGAVGITLVGVWGNPVPATMELRLRGSAEIFRVPIPGGEG